MKTHKTWSYAPYRPFFTEVGEPYICRVAPKEHSITIDWLDTGAKNYQIYCRERSTGAFCMAGETAKTSFTVSSLASDTDYEFYVAADGKQSRVRLARCGSSVGTVVNYIHPDDPVYGFSGRYFGSPSLLRHPDGYLLASMDLFASDHPQNLTLLFRSDDNGASWQYVSELFPCFWGKLFLYQGDVYMLGCSTEYGDLLIGKSSDGGRTFLKPTVLFYGGGGKNGEPGIHKNPQPVVEYNGRLWNTCEWGSWGKGYHAAMVFSAPVGCDLLDADNWEFSVPVQYNPSWQGVPKGKSTGNIEGCLVPMQGGLYNVMRYDMTKMTPNFGKVVSYRVQTDAPSAPLLFDRCLDFPANHVKFEIKYDGQTKMFYSIASRIENAEGAQARNLLSLLASKDGENWMLVRDIYDLRDSDPKQVGVQYVDFLIEDGEILFLCRTAMNGAHSYHDSDFITFDRIRL